MGGIKVSVHPLFFVLGFFYALTGRIFLFAVYTVSAVIHELGHSLVASSLGYTLNKITLMPFGAVISGESVEVNAKDQIKIAIAGPLVSLAVAVLFIAIWWVFPETYAFTETAVSANLALCIINLLPVFPLDGGRIVFSLFSKSLGEKKAKKICKITGIVFSAILFSLFVFSLFLSPNVSLLFFSAFTLFGAINKDKENVYVRLPVILMPSRLKHGARVNRFAVDSSIKVKKLVGLLDASAVNEAIVYKDGKKIALLEQEKLSEILKSGDFNSELLKYTPKSLI